MVSFSNRDAALLGLTLALSLHLNATVTLADRYDDCEQGKISGCTEIIERGERESVDLRAGAYLNRCILYFQENEYDQAIDDCGQTLVLDPTNVDAYLIRGNAYLEKNAVDAAIADLDKVLTINPNETEALRLRGHAYRRSGADDRALSDLDKAIALKESAALYKERGFVYLSNDNDRAAADFSKAMALDPKDAEIPFVRGLCFMTAGKYDQAIADFDTAIALDPNYTKAYFNRGVSYSQVGDEQQAVGDLQKAAQEGYGPAIEQLEKLKKLGLIP